MAITDELRKYVKDHTNWDVVLTTYPPQRTMTYHEGAMDAIADRIDAEHEREVANTRNDALFRANEKDMGELGWVRLPKDADGEYIHVGDEMCGYGWPNGGVYCRAIVNEVTILVGPQDGAYRGWLMWAANECRHYHAPTVEDVLHEFALACEDAGNAGPEIGRLAAEYASRLRLAGEGE